MSEFSDAKVSRYINVLKFGRFDLYGEFFFYIPSKTQEFKTHAIVQEFKNLLC